MTTQPASYSEAGRPHGVTSVHSVTLIATTQQESHGVLTIRLTKESAPVSVSRGGGSCRLKLPG